MISVSPKKDRRCSEACNEYLFAKMWNLILLGFSGATRELSKIRKITRTLKGW